MSNGAFGMNSRPREGRTVIGTKRKVPTGNFVQSPWLVACPPRGILKIARAFFVSGPAFFAIRTYESEDAVRVNLRTPYDTKHEALLLRQ